MSPTQIHVLFAMDALYLHIKLLRFHVQRLRNW